MQRQIFENCHGTDAELARLRAAHADDPLLREALAGFEYPIEQAGEVDGPDSDIDLAAEPALRSGVYGALTLGVDTSNGRFSGVYQASGDPACSLRLRGLLDRTDGPLRAIAPISTATPTRAPGAKPMSLAATRCVATPSPTISLSSSLSAPAGVPRAAG